MAEANFSEEIQETKDFVEEMQKLKRVIEMYLDISSIIRNDTQGFDIYKSADDVNWEVVTKDGCGDKFNYGGRTFLTLEEGMYITTANHFYGTQLHMLTNDKGQTAVQGDLNGDGEVSNADVIMLARYLVHLTDFSGEQIKLADMNGDGILLNNDLVTLARI